MKLKSKRLVSLLAVLILCFCLSLIGRGDASALTYQEEVPVSFTFNGGISISLSSADLIITDLVPGTTDDSNIITVTTSSNISSGYTLYATTGNSTTYPNTNLVNNDNTSSPKTINSLATNASIATMASADASTNGKWGYSYSSNNGSTWTNYSGLPLYTAETGKELIAVNSNTISSIKFKIGAKASANQASGEYKNVVNFIAIGNPEPEEDSGCPTDLGEYTGDVYTMQDFTHLTSNDMYDLKWLMDDDQYSIVDERDGKEYCIALLDDNNIWMTQNLDYDIVDGGADLDSTNTDVPSTWADAGSLTDTYATNDTTWNNYTDQPESYDPGDLCWNGTIDNSYSGTLSDMTTTCTDFHYHIGNYYNWTAAVAMSDSSSYTTDNEDVDQSICPAGWTLPKDGNNTSSGSFSYLANQAGLTAGTSGNIHQAPNYFVYSGHWDGSSNSVGGTGLYWSSVVGSDDGAYPMGFDADDDLFLGFGDGRALGFSVRCVAR